MTTFDEFSKALHSIGWNVCESHNGLNHWIYNRFNEPTAFVLLEDELEVRQNIFGGDSALGKGSCRFPLSDISIKIDKDNTPPEYISIHFNEGCFINLYNHPEV